MADFSHKTTVLVTCPLAATSFLAAELTALGFKVQKELPAGVEVKADLHDCMRMNLHLRSANRVLYQVATFRSRDAQALYRAASKIPWERFIQPDGYLSISSSVENETIRDTRFANQRLKDAIVDRMRSRFGRRPDSGPEQTGVVLFLHWRDDWCKLYIDTSGEPLSRRGYRQNPWKAPMMETLAAAAILATGWQGKGHFINPMCGSGTLAIEAALLAMNSAPGLLRDSYCFMQLPEYDPARWDDLLDKAESAERGEIRGRIVATDIDPQAVEAARSNAKRAGVDSFIEFSVCDFAQTDIPEPTGRGDIVMMNPEYGARLGEEEVLESVYTGIGDFFKKRCHGYNGYVFTGNMKLAGKVGLKANRRIPFHNARIECRLLEYELYSGSRKPR
ncbi:THUMP domain-containing class I SAM-dependent RNA methyltransferase [Oleidesulfovibrio sp.]|uniref:THUMP domain-containing class I SAM-dependent RNA methyltransferase n=1 Tax=Oleidesulfovibrio sp. TaxID=2909707 RepID=UPI003A85C8C8